MADLKLDILVIPTYSKMTLGVADISTYPASPPISSPTITIDIPNGFGQVSIPFTPNDFNVFTSLSLGLTELNGDLAPLPDGVYTLTYSVAPAFENFVTKTIIRVEVLQETFDRAFMKLDLMECDGPIRKQAKEDLNSIYFIINGAIAAANNCAVEESNKLYKRAYTMLQRFLKHGCNCHGNNFIRNF